jgi:Cytochrome P460
MKSKLLYLFFCAIALFTCMASCKKENTDIETALFSEFSSPTGYTYYKNNSTILASSAESAHNRFFRVRFNEIAKNALTNNGKLPVGGTFPTGSIVVKELYDSANGQIVLYAIMKKVPNDANAGSGWIWAEFNANGQIQYSTTKKGAGCISCHNTNGRDLVRLFDLFQ